MEEKYGTEDEEYEEDRTPDHRLPPAPAPEFLPLPALAVHVKEEEEEEEECHFPPEKRPRN